MKENEVDAGAPISIKREWDDNIGRAFGIIDEILYSFALNREIRPSERDEIIYDPYLRRFWLSISNNAVLLAIINWCKLFGSERNNDMYFSHFVSKERVFNRIGETSFLQLSKKMRNIRDKFAAHEDRKSEIERIPEFKEAINVMEVFKEAVQEEYDIPVLPPVKEKYESFQLQIRDCLKNCKIDWELYQQIDKKTVMRQQHPFFGILFSKDSTKGLEGEDSVTGVAYKKETINKTIGIDYDNEKLHKETSDEIIAQWAE